MNESSLKAFRRFGLFAAFFATFVGAVGFAGWMLESDALKTFFRGGISLKANAALGLFCAGVALLLRYEPWQRSVFARRGALLFASVAGLLGGATLFEHTTGLDLHIDQLFFVEPPGAPGTMSPGRMGPPASFCLLLSGVALSLLGHRRRWLFLSQVLGLLIMAIAAMPLIGYGYGLDRLYGIPRYTGIAFHTAAALLVLGAGIVTVRPHAGVAGLICAGDAGGLMARRLLLPAILLPFLASFVRSWGDEGGWLNPAVSRPFSTLFLSICSVLLILFNARSMSKLERARSQAERERARQHAHTREIIETISDGFYALDSSLRIVEVNQQTEKSWGRPRSTLIGCPISNLLPAVATAGDAAAHEEVLRRREPRHYETFSSALERWFEVGLYPDSGGGVAGFFRDVTARKNVEAELRRAKADAERASQAKSEFLATLSHEMRTPLNPVMLTLPLIEALPGLPAEARPYLDSIRKNVELEVHLISDLLDLTRVEKGKLQLQLGDVDVHEVLRAVKAICQKPDTASISLELAASRHCVRGDSARLHQVFWNLVTNAQKFTDAHGRILVRTANESDGSMRVTVTDTGAGIAPDLMPRLFTAFEQGASANARQRAGLGLGLAISRNIVELHHGSISAESAGTGQGATFSVTLPVLASNIAPPPAAPPELRASAQPLRILLVEDHAPTLSVMAQLLRRMGHEVVPAASCIEARAALQSADCNFFISDLGLQDGSGLELMRDLRSRFPGRAIALSGYGTEADVASARDAGFAVHLTKPIQLPALRAAIAECVAGQS